MILKVIWFLIDNFGDQILSALRNILGKIRYLNGQSGDNIRVYMQGDPTQTWYNYPRWANESSNEIMGWKGEHWTNMSFNQNRGLFL